MNNHLNYENHSKTMINSLDLLKGKVQLYDSLFIYNTDGILVLNTDGNVIDANPATEKITGYSIDELNSLFLISCVAEEDIERKLIHCQKALLGIPQEYNISIFNKAGGKLTLLVKMIPIFNKNEVIGLFEIIKDVTEVKKIEQMMHQSEKLSLIGELAAGVAHEIRNPLTTLKGFLEILDSDHHTKYIDIMKTELQRINNIVNEFLLLAKPKEVNFKRNCLGKIINNVIFLLEPQANLKNIQIKINYEDDIPHIHCDENQLKQVFINIIKNAMEAMVNGGNIYIDIRLQNDTVSIAVEDEGCGIPQEKINQIGKPFFTTKEEGTGLGFLVTNKIIENHNGRVTIKSELNKGTIIEITLPIS